MSNKIENESQSQFELDFSEERNAKGEVKVKDKERNEALKESGNTQNGLLGRNEIGLKKPQVLANLSKMELSISNILKTDEIDLLLGKYGLDEALYEANKRYDKWNRKRGKDYSEISQKEMWEETKKMALLDKLRAEVLDFYGVTGRQRVSYRDYVLALLKALKSYGLEGRILKAKEIEERERKSKEYDEEILHILTLITLKFLVWYREKGLTET
jgi:hypothetical protein